LEDFLLMICRNKKNLKLIIQNNTNY